MATAEHPASAPTPRDERPITRTELREELAYALRDYVTKTELHEQLEFCAAILRDQGRSRRNWKSRMVERMAAMESRLIQMDDRHDVWQHDCGSGGHCISCRNSCFSS